MVSCVRRLSWFGVPIPADENGEEWEKTFLQNYFRDKLNHESDQNLLLSKLKSINQSSNSCTPAAV